MKNVIQFLKKRQFLEQVSSEDLQKICEKPCKIYVGFDPTSDSLHLGNLVGIIALRWFQKMGHQPYVLLGGATARIGDPSGKSKERPLLDEKQLKKNAASIRRCLQKLLPSKDPKTAPVFIDNEEWFSKFSYLDFLREVGKQFRVGPMLGKDSVRTRLQSEEGISYTEFSYQILQAYDFYHLFQKEEVCIQAGGSDQWGNITAGIDFVRKELGKSVYGVTFPLLVRSDGKKFGKTEEGAIWLSEEKLSSYDFYQHLLRVPDADVVFLLRMLTFLPEEELSYYENLLQDPNAKPNVAQKKLAEELTLFVHGQTGLQKALEITANMKPGSEAILDAETLHSLSKTMTVHPLKKEEVMGKKYAELLLEIGLVKSKSEAVRLIKNQGAYLNNEKVVDPYFCLSEQNLLEKKYLLFASGKKRKLLIEVR